MTFKAQLLTTVQPVRFREGHKLFLNDDSKDSKVSFYLVEDRQEGTGRCVLDPGLWEDWKEHPE